MAEANKPKLSREDEITGIVQRTKKTSFKDLPRISKRISIIDNTENKNKTLISKGQLLNNNDEEKKINDNNNNNNNNEKKNTNWNRITNILLCIAKQCVLIDTTNANELVYNTLLK
eukprot:827809_1